ncbi:MAG: copper homeostasis protein CutC, partial [Flavobacteriaceae bacterium]
MTYIKEACVEGLQQAINAEIQGANRIELCSHLDLDGLTPDVSTIKEVKKQLSIPIRVMIRPREGNFVYYDKELSLMKEQINTCKEIGVEGVVFGVLNPDNRLNLEQIKMLTQFAFPLKVVIHKAIDLTPNVYESFQELMNINGVSTVLTSGGKPTAESGKEILKEIVDLAEDKIEVLPAGKIDNQNIAKLHQYIGAKAYHG